MSGDKQINLRVTIPSFIIQVEPGENEYLKVVEYIMDNLDKLDLSYSEE